MSQTKFTKGEWKLHEYQTMALIEVDKGAVTICEIEGDGNSANCDIVLNEEQKANAYVMVQSTVMYAMLERLQLSVADEIERDELLKKARGE